MTVAQAVVSLNGDVVMLVVTCLVYREFRVETKAAQGTTLTLMFVCTTLTLALHLLLQILQELVVRERRVCAVFDQTLDKHVTHAAVLPATRWHHIDTS